MSYSRWIIIECNDCVDVAGPSEKKRKRGGSGVIYFHPCLDHLSASFSPLSFRRAFSFL